MKNIKLTLSTTERLLLVAALMNYAGSDTDHDAFRDNTDLAAKIIVGDPADDGPEVSILNVKKNTWE